MYMRDTLLLLLHEVFKKGFLLFDLYDPPLLVVIHNLLTKNTKNSHLQSLDYSCYDLIYIIR